MSVLVEKIAKSKSNTGGEMSQYPPALIDDVSISTSSSSISIEFTWPNDTILGGDTLVQVSEIVCLIKKGDIPYNIEDGYDNIQTITSKSVNSVTFSGLESETKYYIRFYVYGTNGECNDSGEMIYEVTTSKPIDTVLGNNDWSTIIEVAESGNAQDYWQVGDEIQLQLSGYYNVTCTLQIYDFNHFDKSDGTGKANICFGCKDVYIIDRMYNNASNTMGWMGTDMKNDNMNNILNSMPSVLQSAIKEVEILYNKGRSTTLLTSNDKVFLPSLTEIGSSNMSSVPNCGSKFPIFTDTDSMVKYNVETGYNYHYWTRNAATGSSYGYYFISTIKLSTGDFRVTPNTRDADTDSGVVFCFNI